MDARPPVKAVTTDEAPEPPMVMSWSLGSPRALDTDSVEVEFLEALDGLRTAGDDAFLAFAIRLLVD